MARNILRNLCPGRTRLVKLMPLFGMLAVGGLAFIYGRFGVPSVRGQARNDGNGGARNVSKTESQERVVAYIYETTPITREELGEFLIARFGAERLEFLVNRRIVELECRSRGIQLTNEMIEAQLDRDLRSLSVGKHLMTRKDFEQHILKRFNKTLFEWKEDVIRPKLMLAQLVEPQIKVTEEDVRKGFEGRYGPKVECRWLVIPDDKYKGQIWEKARQGEAEFDRLARNGNDPRLAQTGGKAPPIHKHFGDANIERIAFNLQEGEVSQMIGLPEGKSVVILKCDKHIPEDRSKRIEDERLTLMQEIHALKMSQRIPEVFAEMRKRANPQLLLRKDVRQDDAERAILQEIQGQSAPAASPPAPNRVGG